MKKKIIQLYKIGIIKIIEWRKNQLLSHYIINKRKRLKAYKLIHSGKSNLKNINDEIFVHVHNKLWSMSLKLRIIHR